MRHVMTAAVVAGLFLGAASASAQEDRPDRGLRFHGLGPRVGFCLDPDQFVFGGHLDFGDPLPHFTLLLPVVEIGVGDHRTLTSLGGQLLYRFYDRWGAWTPILGPELDFFILNVDNPGGGSDTSSDLGLMGVFGVEKGLGENRFTLELKFQIADSPDLKLMASWTFGH